MLHISQTELAIISRPTKSYSYAIPKMIDIIKQGKAIIVATKMTAAETKPVKYSHAGENILPPILSHSTRGTMGLI
jgi:hypothetical protein